MHTHHLPYTVPFEREFFQRLGESGYKGLLFLDDIRFNDDMKKWWAELLNKASEMGYRCFDLTSVGHSTGSGLVDFSSRVELIEQKLSEEEREASVSMHSRINRL
uniref:Uncharacterized protein n=1 Tax=Amphora coffeiformis TaxID=265554 RepID=A0A7S3P8B1_9STRA|eukprot:scaffold2043_cov166-Amphora_coffeaeformis.AAC.25